MRSENNWSARLTAGGPISSFNMNHINQKYTMKQKDKQPTEREVFAFMGLITAIFWGLLLASAFIASVVTGG